MSSVTQLNAFPEPQIRLNNETKMNEPHWQRSSLDNVSRGCLVSPNMQEGARFIYSSYQKKAEEADSYILFKGKQLHDYSLGSQC